MDASELLAVDPASLSGADLSEHVVALAAFRSCFEAALLAAVAPWDSAQEWAADACPNPTAWLVHNVSRGRAEARALVRDAHRLVAHPTTGAALPEMVCAGPGCWWER